LLKKLKIKIMQKKKTQLASTIITGAIMAVSGLSANGQASDAIRPFQPTQAILRLTTSC
jgi:hypothetical protein